MHIPPAPLKYLFAAHLADGTEIFQGTDDLSPVTPNRNCFYELLEHDENGDPILDAEDRVVTRPDIEIFQLEGDGSKYLVDLVDGHFEVNGMPFYVGDPPEPGTKLRLVYFRRVRQSMVSVVQAGRLVSRTHAGTETEYHFGWQSGKTKRIIVLV